MTRGETAQGSDESYERGIELAAKGNYEAAVTVLEGFVAVSTDFPRREQARMALGFAKGQINDWQGAIKCFHDAMVNDIECLPAYTALGHAHLMAGEGDKAIEYFRIAVQKDPRNPQARNGLGDALLKTNSDLDEALYQAQEALRLSPGSAAIRDTVGWILYQHGDLEAAAEQLEEAVRIDPDHQVILAHRREVRDALKRKSAKRGVD